MADIRVKRMNPSTLTINPNSRSDINNSVTEKKITLETSKLPEGDYTVAFTDQWSNQSFYCEILRILPNRKGVEFCLSNNQMSHSVSESGSVLYDVHLVWNSSKRSENRRALTLINETLETSSIATSDWNFEPV